MTKRVKIFKLVFGLILSFIGLYLLIDSFKPVDSSKYLVKDNQLTSLSGYLTDKWHYTFGKGNGKNFRIKLNTYPDVSFENESIFLEATDWTAIKADVQYHDTVSIKVLKAEFDKYYIKKDSLTLLQQIANYPTNKFAFYSFKFKNKEYVSSLYEAAKNHHRESSFPQFIIGLAFIGMGIFFIITKK